MLSVATSRHDEVPVCRPKLPKQLKNVVYAWAIWQFTQVLLLWVGAHYGWG